MKEHATEEILVSTTSPETRVALIHQGVLKEFYIDRQASRGQVGNVYAGIVNRVLPGMQSAFIDIGLERSAFLHVTDLWQSRTQDGNSGPAPIERLLYPGQPLLVQVIKDPIGSKGARLTTQISIAGRMLVHLPHDPHVGIAQRITDEPERLRLLERVKTLMKAGEAGDGNAAGGAADGSDGGTGEASARSTGNGTSVASTGSAGGGFIIRTLAEGATDEALLADINYLRRRWTQILEAAKNNATGKPAGSRQPELLYGELELSQRALRDLAGPDTQAIIVDHAETLATMREFCRTYMPNLEEKLRLHAGSRPLFDLYQVDEEVEKALARRVPLKSGGYLIFDQTEALTTIDVNTGGYISGRNFDDTVFRTNLEAAQTLARQLQLRNLGGIIIVDFIDMHNATHQEAVLQALGAALQHDRTRTTVNGFTSLGLVEMTRKRTRDSLERMLCEPCTSCHGKGTIKTARTVCYEIMREIAREARQFDPKEFRIVASQPVIDLLLDEESPHLAILGEQIGKPVTLHVEPSYAQEEYDIILA
ncbi:MAG: ribonuclease E/G [Lautropia sp.]|nr:ribonuclease E/G [Lautropia sp.]